jgi:hypothetical protein
MSPCGDIVLPPTSGILGTGYHCFVQTTSRITVFMFGLKMSYLHVSFKKMECIYIIPEALTLLNAGYKPL